MITICPSCQRQFRIYARQLSAAGGRVQCGFCGEQFNALERLHDSPLHPDHAGSAGESPFVPANPPVAGGPDREHQSEYADIGPDPVEGLLQPEPPRRSWLATTLWSFGVLLLLAALFVQLAWFNRDRLLERYPEFIPQVKQLCERYACDVVRERDLDAIVLVNRDVRNHPRFNDALLVNLTIENRSGRPQPYPGIQFMLFDNNGTMTGFRRLQAADYLEPGTLIDTGLPPGQPLHLVLEVAETTDKPVGFEFAFFYP